MTFLSAFSAFILVPFSKTEKPCHLGVSEQDSRKAAKTQRNNLAALRLCVPYFPNEHSWVQFGQ